MLRILGLAVLAWCVLVLAVFVGSLLVIGVCDLVSRV